MKLGLLFTLLIAITGCATKAEKKIIEESKRNTPITLEQKKQLLKNLISKHDEFDKATKKKLEKSLISTLDRAQKLRDRESQLIQEILDQTLVKKTNYDLVLRLKKELKEVYSKKYANFNRAIIELKKVVGIRPDNQSLSSDLGFEFFSGR